MKPDHYFLYDEIVGALRDFVRKYPSLCSLSGIGSTREGRDIWCLTVCNDRTGAAEDKAAFFMDGNLHSGEVASSMAVLYTLDRWLSAYGKDPEQVLDIYYPAGTEKPLPTIVSVHGGAYVYGSKELYRFYCMSLAQRGFAVVNFSYRLAPEYRYPAQLQDTNAVMRYVCAHAEENFIDTDRIFIVGDSAGAQLASQYAAAVTNPAYADILGMEIPKFRLRACAFNCGLYRPDPRRDKLMLKCYFDDPDVIGSEQMDVLGHITDSYPPVFIMSSNGDFLLDRVKEFADLLTMKGVEHEVHIYSPKDRKLGHVFHCNMNEPYAKQCNDEECAFFRKLLSHNSFI